MKLIEIAHKCVQLNSPEEAIRAYKILLAQQDVLPEEKMEAANYIFLNNGDYKISYDTYLSLYKDGYFQPEIMNLLQQAFYEPNVEEQKALYQKNIEALKKYPYLFKKDFPAFEELTVLFFPYDDNGVIPYDVNANAFGEYVNFNDPVINRYFFKDLEKPILATDVYSQYQLEYLNDNVRESRWVAKENHIYAHYTNWQTFCAYLQCLDLSAVLKNRKFVFLIEDEITQYPIDFKERFGIDYSEYEVKPIGIREVNRMIWHTQLSSSNGGDFFNEVFYGHPNLLCIDSLWFTDLEDMAEKTLKKIESKQEDENLMYERLKNLVHPTEKDVLVAFYMSHMASAEIDPTQRIAPALFIQPHFPCEKYDILIRADAQKCIVEYNQYEQIKKSKAFRNFKYIKTFSPLRRPTTSYASTIRFMEREFRESKQNNFVIGDEWTNRVASQCWRVDLNDRLFHDSVLVRFEDGKLNPKATFTALAEFLDIPYTESMTYCSDKSGKDPLNYVTNARGFDPRTVYSTYDEFVDDAERALMEFILRDTYKIYGYDFHYYDENEVVDAKWVKEHADGAVKLNDKILKSLKHALETNQAETAKEDNKNTELSAAEQRYQEILESRKQKALRLAMNYQYEDKNHNPLQYMKMLKLDEKLLEKPLYH